MDPEQARQVLVDRALMLNNLEQTARRLTDEPGFGVVAPRVSTELIRDTQARSRFEQYGNEYEFHCDESTGRGGRGEAPSPLRYFLSGVAFCQQVWYAKASAIVGFELTNLRIDVSASLDMRGEHRVGDAPSHPEWLELEAIVGGSGPDHLVVAMADEANARCPLFNLVRRAVPVYEVIRRESKTLRDTRPHSHKDA